MNTKINEVQINGIDYVKKDSINNVQAEKLDDMEYVIVRTYSAGCFAGYLKKREGKEVTLMQVTRLWYWDGAFTLSQLAIDGVSKPENCNFSIQTNNHLLLEVIEIIPTTEKSRISIQGVKPCKK